ncbi:MAG TPA: molybdopterin-guanine dinucleotide biosynthesis protein B [Nitrospirota bacterium]|nr:molybdopterin-guanine dinucleotide biosynthesis protein B [Nitrospirota bacterium]
MRIVSFVAVCSNSGKTTLIEKIIPHFTARGLRVAVVKHASKGFDLDTPGKDSWRFQQAGAASVVLAGPDRIAVMKTTSAEQSADDMIRAAGDADIVMLEGFKRTSRNKIEVYRSSATDRLPLCLQDNTFLALASDRPFEVPIPQFNLNDAEGVAKFILTITDEPHPD